MSESAPKARPPRVARAATVRRTERLTEDLVRVVAVLDDPASMPELTFTDHYVKMLFPPAGADYRWPFDAEALKATLPREQWPVTRTYTVRSWDADTGELTLDFVVHGDAGIAGPWALAARPGDTFGFFGPGGGWAPQPDADVHLLVGDESALPAIAAAMEALPDGVRAQVFLETRGPGTELPLPAGRGTTLTWVHREAGDSLVERVRGWSWPQGRLEAFVHGNAEMVRALRRYLFVERGLPRAQASISGYWRPGHDEDTWQATKREFVATMDAEEGLTAG